MFHILESLGKGQGIRKVVQAWAQTDHWGMVLHTVQEAAISASHLLNANIVAQSFDKNKTTRTHFQIDSSYSPFLLLLHPHEEALEPRNQGAIYTQGVLMLAAGESR